MPGLAFAESSTYVLDSRAAHPCAAKALNSSELFLDRRHASFPRPRGGFAGKADSPIFLRKKSDGRLFLTRESGMYSLEGLRRR